jgi:hypothetical protein
MVNGDVVVDMLSAARRTTDDARPTLTGASVSVVAPPPPKVAHVSSAVAPERNVNRRHVEASSALGM